MINAIISMNMNFRLTKKDCLVIFCCAGFSLMSLGAIGGGSRKHAKDIVCRSNLHQLYLAMCEFTNDNNGSFWTGYDWTNMVNSRWWVPALKDYYGEMDEIRLCPTTKTRYAEDGVTPGPGWGKEPFAAWGYNSWLDAISRNQGYENCHFGSYADNGWIEDRPDHLTDPAIQAKFWRNINKISKADTVPFLLDAQWIDCWPEPYHEPPPAENTMWGTSSGQFDRIVQNRHEQAENCAFIDGTVRNVGLKELWTLKWHRLYNTEGPWTLAGGATPASWPAWMQDMEAY
jgi:hypothetical protein